MEKIVILIMLGVCTSIFALTISKAKVFTWLRAFLGTPKFFIFRFLHSMVTCPYCLSFYPAFYLTHQYFDRINYLGTSIYTDFAVYWFCIVAVASLTTGLVFTAISKVD